MKKWKAWAVGIVCFAVTALSALVSAVWNNVQTEWDVEKNAAQFALNHSPINRIVDHQVFTADDAQEVFYGHDVFQRGWYAFVFGSPFQVKYVPQTDVLAEQRIKQIAFGQGTIVDAIHLGYLQADTQTAFHTTSTVVYEIYGTNKQGTRVFTYYDATSGRLLWQYVV